MNLMNRGSEWHRWEPHIHAPGTVLADQFSVSAWEEYLQALETASPTLRAIGVTDYYVTKSYERVKEEKNRGRLKDCDLLFPNIELRLNTGTSKGNFVNIHLLVSPQDPLHVDELNRFLGRLIFTAFDDEFACTPNDLIRLGRRADPKNILDESALEYGCTQFKVSLENLIDAYRGMAWAVENILIVVAGNADGTSGVRDAADTTLREEIEKTAHAIFAGSPKQRDFWLGHGKASADELRARYGGPKPCLWGSDAHSLPRVAKPDDDRFCWMKGAVTFDALRQACIDPERAYVGSTPSPVAAPSQLIDRITIENSRWAKTPEVRLSTGLVAVIGARGSGKTALADIIAVGSDSYESSAQRASFITRAAEHLVGGSVTVNWLGGDVLTRALDTPVNESPEAYPRVRYLSQQFVEELCSIEGMPALIREIERVIFEAHSWLQREGSVDFQELLDLRARQYREARVREEAALALLSDQIGIELEKKRQVASLKVQVTEKEKLIARYREDRRKLLPKDQNKTAERLQALVSAAEKVRGYIRHFVDQRAALINLGGEIRDLRENVAPETLRSMRYQHKKTGIENTEWDRFLLNYSGDVDGLVSAKKAGAEHNAQAWKGQPPNTPLDASGTFIAVEAELNDLPLAVLEAEIGRVEKLVATDKATADKLTAVTKRIESETSVLNSLREQFKDCEGASQRAIILTTDREQGYRRVFDAILSEERVLNELYAPLQERLRNSSGTLAKLSFIVRRVVDVQDWAQRGEDDLFDLRGGPFKGIGSLEKEADRILAPAWTTGNSDAVCAAMTEFRTKHQDALLEKAPYPQTDQPKYRPWARRFAQWLYSTEHISIEYGIRYNDIEIDKLSPGTRGVVLILLYLALDDADDRPLIIDQPEENLDPKSVYDELVPLFKSSKQRRQVIMVTHNPNLVVNTDADQIIVADVGMHRGEGIPPIRYTSGGLEEAHIRKAVCDILEGGELAFRDRARRLRITLAR